jgi:hypothetical protein
MDDPPTALAAPLVQLKTGPVKITGNQECRLEHHTYATVEEDAPTHQCGVNQVGCKMNHEMEAFTACFSLCSFLKKNVIMDAVLRPPRTVRGGGDENYRSL